MLFSHVHLIFFFRFYEGVVDSFDAVKKKHTVRIMNNHIGSLMLCCWK